MVTHKRMRPMNLQDLTDDELAALLKKIELEQERRRQKAKQGGLAEFGKNRTLRFSGHP